MKTNNMQRENKWQDEFIRDVTQVGSLPKSEVRRRLNEIVDRAVAERDKEIVEMIREVTTYDHTKCPVPQTCIGYQNCVSDIENGVISNLIIKDR